MSSFDDLISQVTDKHLKDRLKEEYLRFSRKKKFGLVFEEHIPECTPLHGVSIETGASVVKKQGLINEIYLVLEIIDGDAKCLNKKSKEIEKIDISKLITVSEFGTPIFPTLKPIDSVMNEPLNEFWHILIEADNYHALQLLEYIYPKKVDCIYIDPPYNTGARDWKYNNNFVDENDSWRHSKWLSMMKKRLELAKNILADDGVMITTIDDNEFAHLSILLNEIFPHLNHTCITIQHNPGGTQGKKFSVTHEYAIYSYAKNSTIFPKKHMGGEVYKFIRWGSTSHRYEGKTTFYPIIVDKDLNILGFGEVLDNNIHPASQVEIQEDGTYYIWPIDDKGIERKWRYGRSTVEDVQHRLFIEEINEKLIVKIQRESEFPKTVWTDTLFSAEAHGTDMIKAMIDDKFSYPKSLYAVAETLRYAVAGKKDALILDFFAGSGTTMNAVNLINSEDEGNRQCIMVTNNEVSEKVAKKLSKSGYQPGDKEWESQGICNAITWPRTRNSILGKLSDGSELKGEYHTNQLVSLEKKRKFYHLGFLDDSVELTISAKKQLVAFIKDSDNKKQIPQTLVKKDTTYIVSEKSNSSILFDIDAEDEWLKELENHKHITNFYIIVKSPSKFKNLKLKIERILGNFIVNQPYKRPFKQGFPENVEYFKLEFLDKNKVTLGQQFDEILPLLWLKSGAIGQRPELNDSQKLGMIVLPENKFAVLLDESFYSEFIKKVNKESQIESVYFVTNSETAFQDMSQGIKKGRTYQLYRDYIDNFVLGTRRNF